MDTRGNTVVLNPYPSRRWVLEPDEDSPKFNVALRKDTYSLHKYTCQPKYPI